MKPAVAPADIPALVHKIVDETPILDIHTHLYTPRFGGLLLWGIDELLTYHYLVAEVFRVAPMPYEKFWAMSKQQQAEHIWKNVFLDRSPISEPAVGVLTILKALGLDPGERDLNKLRKWFAATTVEAHVDRILKASNVHSLIMTNDPFDDQERPAWLQGQETDKRFQAALRLDPLLNDWNGSAVPRLKALGYDVKGDLGPSDIATVKRFLTEWVERMQPRYMAVSLTPTFKFPDDGPHGKVLEQCILPVAREAGIPFAMMIGVQRQINPGLRLAGDGVAKADVGSVARICQQFPENRFLVTLLSRENQHELCIVARKNPNLHIFGCWWFLCVPSMIEEMTRMRVELLGVSFTPQHSDCRVLDQLIYKWGHSKRIIAKVLAEKYTDLAQTGWNPTEAEIRKDVADYFGGNFERFCASAKR